ncbi:MAG: cation diffusion facilitator family transporter [Fimbriimonas sp.]
MSSLAAKGLEIQKKRAAAVSLLYNLVLTILKLVAAVLTGSVSLLSEGVHSATDVVASFIAFLSIRAASVPPDDEHPYGHGKIESLAGLGESVLLLMIVVYIVFEAIQRLILGASVQNLGIGLWVMGISSISSLAVGIYVRRVGLETQSVALKSNGQHLMVDFWTSVGVLFALLLTQLTGWRQADAIVAILLACWIAFGAVLMSREAIDQLIDRKIPPDEMAAIERILNETQGCLSWHKLRTRHSGHVHYIDVHIVVPNDWSVVQAHDLADSVEKRIQAELAPAHAVIHVDPYDPLKSGI